MEDLDGRVDSWKELTSAMLQQGQTIELTRRGPAGERLRAFRYRTGGRSSKRVQRALRAVRRLEIRTARLVGGIRAAGEHRAVISDPQNEVVVLPSGERLRSEREPISRRVRPCLALVLAEQPDEVRAAVPSLLGRDPVLLHEVLCRVGSGSLAMIDRHYGHLARDGRERAVALLDGLAADETAWTRGGRRVRCPEPARREGLRHR